VSFNISGQFKQRFYQLHYMSCSLLAYQLLVLYLLFNADVSRVLPQLEAFNESVMQFFGVVFG